MKTEKEIKIMLEEMEKGFHKAHIEKKPMIELRLIAQFIDALEWVLDG